MTRVLVCGGRDFASREFLNSELDRIHAARGFSLVITGGARGADTFAAQWARSRGLPTEVYKADWTAHGRAAGPIRNKRMLVEGKPDLVVAFRGGKGTANMLAQAVASGTETTEVRNPMEDMRYRHVKRGGVYEVMGLVTVQTEMPLSDNEKLVLYRRDEDGSLWVRPMPEFLAKFVEL